MKMVCLQMIMFLYLLITNARISLMIAVVEKCKENKEEARFLLESAPLEGSYNEDCLKSFGLESRFSKSVELANQLPCP